MSNNNTEIDFKNKSNHIDIQKIIIGIKSEVYIENKRNSKEIFEVKHNILKFYIEFFKPINFGFDFKREDIKLLQIIAPSNVLSKEDLPILSLISKFCNLLDCDPDIIISQ